MKKLFQGRIFTIPNLLSLLRLCMIPWFVWLYTVRENAVGAGLVLLLSGATDTVDGMIARRFDMVSDLGKALDPLADKLTQVSMLYCLARRFPLVLLPLGLLCVKELFCAATNLMVIQRTGEVSGALWHGKVTTALLYATMILHLLWRSIPPALSTALLIACAAMIALSGILYGLRNLAALRKGESA